MFHEGEGWVSGALLHRNGNVPGNGQLRGGGRPGVQFIDRKPDPRPESDSPAMLEYSPAEAPYIGAFGDEKNWLEEWTFFGPEAEYDTRGADGAGDRP